MNKSEQINELFAALAKAQGQMHDAEKSSTNPHFKTKYADLAAVHRAVRKPLSDNGIAFSQPFTVGEGYVEVETILGHTSGQYMSEALRFPVPQFTPQGIGSAVSYARRYALMGMTGIAAGEPGEEDDDAESAMPPVREQTAKPAWPKAPIKKPIVPMTMAPLPPKVNGAASLRDKARGMAREGTKAFNQWWAQLTDDQCNELGVIAEELAELGFAADQAETVRAG